MRLVALTGALLEIGVVAYCVHHARRLRQPEWLALGLGSLLVACMALGVAVDLGGGASTGSGVAATAALAIGMLTSGSLVWFRARVGAAARRRHERAAQQALEAAFLVKSERFVTSIVATTPAMIYVFDAVRRRCVYINEEGASVVGYTPAEYIGRDEAFILDTVHPEDREMLRRSIADIVAAEDGTIVEVEYRMRHRDGTWHHFLDRQTVLGRDGSSVHVLGTALDVTERRRVAEELGVISTRLHDVIEAGGITLFSASPAPPFALRFVSANAATVLGWTHEQLVSRETFFYELVHPDDRAVMAAAAGEALLAGAGTLEYRFQSPSGAYRWLRSCARVVRDAEGRPCELAGSTIDVTETKHIEELFRRRERLAAIGTLAAGIAHEINNPTAAMLMSAELALACFDEPAERARMRQCIVDIVDEAKRCGRIVKGVLQFAREERSEKWPTDLNVLVRRVVDRMRGSVAARGIRLETRLTPDLEPAFASPVQIEQVVVNLVSNAVDAADLGVTVVVATSRKDGALRLVVSDDGPGIPAGVRGLIFDPFFTTRQLQGGTGLGLSMCHGIVSDHDGHIEIASIAGEGCTVTVTLPMASGAPQLERIRSLG